MIGYNQDNYFWRLAMKFKSIVLLGSSLLFINSSYVFSSELIVGTYNIDAKVIGNHEAQRDLMINENVTIFGLQEINYKNKRFSDKNITSYNAIDSFINKYYKYFYYGNAVDFSHGGYGIATISKIPVKDESTHKLVLNKISNDYSKNFEDIYRAYEPLKKETVVALDGMWGKDGIATKGVMEPRVYTRVVIQQDGKEIAFYNSHLSFESKQVRNEQMKQIMSAMEKDPVEYKVLVGDFNADQSTLEWDIWRDKFNLVNGKDNIWYDTFLGVDPSMNVNSVDNIIVSKNINIKSFKRIDSKLSDHMPLVATLELK